MFNYNCVKFIGFFNRQMELWVSLGFIIVIFIFKTFSITNVKLSDIFVIQIQIFICLISSPCRHTPHHRFEYTWRLIFFLSLYSKVLNLASLFLPSHLVRIEHIKIAASSEAVYREAWLRRKKSWWWSLRLAGQFS